MRTSLAISTAALWLAAVAFTPPALAGGTTTEALPRVAVGPQYDTTHVYVSPGDVDRFAHSFLATFGGSGSKQVVATVTPTPSSTTSQLLQTPVGTISLFGFTTPIPYPFGAERTGYLVTDLDVAIRAARAAGANVLVAPFPDPIGRDAVIQWPGGVNMQLYWHTVKSSYPALQSVPENRVYVSPDAVETFVSSFLRFAQGTIVSDERHAPGIEIGRPNDTYRRVRIASNFGRMTVNVTDGQLPFPFGRELTGYEVSHLGDTLASAARASAVVLAGPYAADHRNAAMIQFPGGYIAEIHEVSAAAPK
ncbi:MAG: glyoxalase [Gammaproteobacteria bacterium]